MPIREPFVTAIFDERKSGHRIGQLKLNQDWDSVLLVLMNEDFETVEIYEATREDIAACMEETGGSRRSRRGALSVARFRIIGRLLWSKEHGLEDDGYWDNQAETV